MTDAKPAGQFPVLSCDLQVRFWARLQLIRNEFLFDALAKTVEGADIQQVDKELAKFVGGQPLAALAAHSLRGETFFPVPLLLQSKPALLGYYRLLYGISQKEFYKAPFSRFRRMEVENQLSSGLVAQLPALCGSLIETAWSLLQGIQPVSLQAIHELQLLTIGPQLRGSENNVIGQGATRSVFSLLREHIERHVQSSTDSVLTVKNAAGRIVQISFAPDPDIAIVEILPSQVVPSVSIEIKGGTDDSNVHNRIGEAEKSHQKARAAGFTRFWTIIRARIDAATAHKESPTTQKFFDLHAIQTPGAAGYEEFRDLLFQTIGVS